ncbi:sulfotransferase 2B1-like [Protopterus annectens]|uniref:sulfotransferase 2B1-like n=1 Tax=Protopterus annectens TaxID=7888 RepID=UPI001CFBC2B1|nr:sulfotransferase 2B1-like [Protopterus annectens]
MSEKYIRYQGIIFPAISSEESHFQYVRNEFQVRDNDIFNITFPKSGTTWMLEILSLIYKNGDATWCNTVQNWERAPWVEAKDLCAIVEKNTSQRLISSHLPIQLFPKSIYNSNAKIVYTARNPRDVVVSLHYMCKTAQFLEPPENFTETLDLFLKGEVIYGNWFDHITGWLGMKDKLNILYITYEELKKDLRGSVVKLCNFLGKELDDAAIDSVVENASFKVMKNNNMSNFSQSDQINANISPFMRKGVTGDWKNHFTVAQSEHFDAVYQERMKDVKMKFPWDQTSIA